MSTLLESRELSTAFSCFGGQCGVWITVDQSTEELKPKLLQAKRCLLDLHDRFTRFERCSELSLLNDNPHKEVPISPVMARFVDSAIYAANMTEGLVDPTLLHQIEQAGYRSHHEGSLPLELSLALTPSRAPAAPSQLAWWREIRLTNDARTLERPPGLKLDSGGLAKGLFADMIGQSLRSMRGYGIDAAGDLRIGGCAGIGRPVRVASPFDASVLHEYEIRDGGVATSGISRRSWLDDEGRPAHHLLDPSTGRPAFTGIVQATALAPSALEAEIRAKAALLSGPTRAPGWLIHGGTIVYDNGTFTVI
jgi:thiamine biosynthesis lipoprotein